MPRRQFNQNTLKLGMFNVICDVCGFKFKSGDIQERWDNLMVCKDDYEERHPSDFLRGTPDDPSIPFVRPDDAGTESSAPDSYVDTLTDIPAGTNNGEL